MTEFEKVTDFENIYRNAIEWIIEDEKEKPSDF